MQFNADGYKRPNGICPDKGGGSLVAPTAFSLRNTKDYGESIITASGIEAAYIIKRKKRIEHRRSSLIDGLQCFTASQIGSYECNPILQKHGREIHLFQEIGIGKLDVGIQGKHQPGGGTGSRSNDGGLRYGNKKSGQRSRQRN